MGRRSIRRQQLARMNKELSRLKSEILDVRNIQIREYTRKGKTAPPRLFERMHILQDKAKWLDREIGRYKENADGRI